MSAFKLFYIVSGGHSSVVISPQIVQWLSLLKSIYNIFYVEGELLPDINRDMSRRKRKKKSEKTLTHRLNFVMKPDDYLMIKQAADLTSVSLSEFIRHCSLLQSKFILQGQYQQSNESKPLVQKLGSYQEERTAI
jgi:hypothetical protein